MSKRYNYSFVDKKTGSKQKRPLILAGVSALLLAAAAVISIAAGGAGGAFLGGFGLGGMLFALWGFISSIKMLSKRMTARMVFAGAISCGIMFIVWLALFLIGVR